MRTGLVVGAGILLSAASLLAQTSHPNLTGRWRLVEPTAAERAQDTFAITSPDELLLTQTALALIVEHPSKSGTHPAAGVFKYGVSGSIGAPIDANPSKSTRSIMHIGTQLIISDSTTSAADAGGAQVTVAQGSIWQREGSNRLVIEFSEERTGERQRIAKRTYVKIVVP